MRLTIDGRFNGPAGSGNGGYSCGLFAAALATAGTTAELTGTVEVTLRVPPPLDTPLAAEPSDGGIAVRAPDGTLVASASPAAGPPGPPVPAVPLDEARAAASAYPGFVEHPFPTCFVCGPARVEGDGLRIFPGPVARGGTAAPWRVPAGVDPIMVWASLDCPGGWAVLAPARPYVLGRMAAVIDAVPDPGSDCVVVGALTGVDGRKARVRTALYAPDGDLLAQAVAVWIAI